MQIVKKNNFPHFSSFGVKLSSMKIVCVNCEQLFFGITSCDFFLNLFHKKRERGVIHSLFAKRNRESSLNRRQTR